MNRPTEASKQASNSSQRTSKLALVHSRTVVLYTSRAQTKSILSRSSYLVLCCAIHGISQEHSDTNSIKNINKYGENKFINVCMYRIFIRRFLAIKLCRDIQGVLLLNDSLDLLRNRQGDHLIWKPEKPGNVMKFRRTWKSRRKSWIFFGKSGNNLKLFNLIFLSSEKSKFNYGY